MTGDKVIIAGGAGFLGQYVTEEIKALGIEPIVPRSAPWDFRGESRTFDFFMKYGHDVDYFFNLAAKVGGILYNQNHPYDLMLDNLLINTNLIHTAIAFNVKKFIQIGTTCSYPKFAPIPFSERAIWDGYPEETNAPYGIAKRAAMSLIDAANKEHNFNGINLIPTNLYGPGDNFEDEKSHVIPALIKRFHKATTENWDVIEIWGSGNASRDFLHVRDAARAIVLAALNYERHEPLNIGSGSEIRIATIAFHLQEISGFKGKLQWDTSKPDGQPRRCLDIRDIKKALNWEPAVRLKEGLKETYDWYVKSL